MRNIPSIQSLPLPTLLRFTDDAAETQSKETHVVNEETARPRSQWKYMQAWARNTVGGGPVERTCLRTGVLHMGSHSNKIVFYPWDTHSAFSLLNKGPQSFLLTPRFEASQCSIFILFT